MGAKEVIEFFETFIRGFILTDIEREMVLAKSGITLKGEKRDYLGGGNYLCALGLLSYTEFMGGIKERDFSKNPDVLFNSFLYSMGSEYEDFDRTLSSFPSINRPKQKLSIYEVFRCGMVHEYFIKASGVISMFADKVIQEAALDGDVSTLSSPPPSTFIGYSSHGLGKLDDGRYFFIVENYHRDFSKACDNLLESILSMPYPSIPSLRK